MGYLLKVQTINLGQLAKSQREERPSALHHELQKIGTRYYVTISDFKSTSIASYVAHKLYRELVKAPPNLTTDVKVKFEGASTAKDAYQQWALPPRYQRHRAEYAPSQAGFDATTTYKNTYIPKTAGILSPKSNARSLYSPNSYLCPEFTKF